MRIAEWRTGREPILQVEKRGRFITGMGHADFVAAAVASADDRIRGTAFVLIEKADEGTFDPGVRARKLVHQLASARDPVFSVRVPAGRIIGATPSRTVRSCPTAPTARSSTRCSAGLESPVGLMTAAKMLSAVEPVIRYHRSRFRGGDAAQPGSRRFELGLQQEEDALHRLVDVWAAGEAAASLGFAAARVFDELDPLERQVDAHFARRASRRAVPSGGLWGRPSTTLWSTWPNSGSPRRRAEQAGSRFLARDPLVRFVLLDAVASVLGPAVKLWNTATVRR